MMTLPINRSFFRDGGTGVEPVKSGVAPDFVGRRGLRGDARQEGNCGRPAGFGRDARNHRLEACATRK